MKFANPIQQGIYTALINSAPLDALLARHHAIDRAAIYDYVPQPGTSGDDDLYPMVTIGEDNLNDWSTDTESGADASAMVHVWSRSGGWSQPKQVSAAVYDALHRQELTIPDAYLVTCEFEMAENMRDPDGLTLHVAMRFRILVDEAA